jgi:hypothetical protein
MARIDTATARVITTVAVVGTLFTGLGVSAGWAPRTAPSRPTWQPNDPFSTSFLRSLSLLDRTVVPMV